MKPLQIIVLAIGLVALTGSMANAQPPIRQIGLSPQSAYLDVTVNVPAIVGIYLSNDVGMNLGLAPNVSHYPPAAFPGYYIDNALWNPTVALQVFCNRNAVWTCTVLGNLPEFYVGGPLVSELWYADRSVNPGIIQTPDGTPNPPAPWTQFSNLVATPVASGAVRTTGWEAHNQDMELQMSGDEISGTGTIRMTYTMAAP